MLSHQVSGHDAPVGKVLRLVLPVRNRGYRNFRDVIAGFEIGRVVDEAMGGGMAFKPSMLMPDAAILAIELRVGIGCVWPASSLEPPSPKYLRRNCPFSGPIMLGGHTLMGTVELCADPCDEFSRGSTTHCIGRIDVELDI
jgi:hypothetical protein